MTSRTSENGRLPVPAGGALALPPWTAAAAPPWWPVPRLSAAAAAAGVLARLRFLRGSDAAEPAEVPPDEEAAVVATPAPPAGGPRRQAVVDDPDAELLDQVLAEYPHETRWFSALVQRHWGRVWSVCQAVLLDADDAEEAAQNAFLKVHRYLPSYRRESVFRAWVARIARRAALDLLASRRREREARARLEGDPSLIRSWLPARAADPARPGLDLRRALERMDERDRIVLVLHEIEGLSYEEVAELLELSGGAVRMAAMRARQRLREFLERAEGRTA